MAYDNEYWAAATPQPTAAAAPEPPAAVAAGSQQAAPAPVSAPHPAAPKKRHGVLIAVIIILALIALIVFGASSCTSNLTKTSSSSTTYKPNTVAVITLDGTIQYDGTECSPEGLKSLLDQAEDDANIKAVVLRVNSGGGTATAGEEMAQYVREFSKPIVVSSASINASAAYEISSQTNYIFTAKTTEIGAIGTAMQVTDLSGLMEKLGISMDNIVSADSKDSSYGTRPLTEAERAYYQGLVDQINTTFVDNVAQGRHLSHDQAAALATGLPFTGITAVTNGVADQIGTLEDACDKAAELSGCAGNYSTSNMSIKSSSLSSLLGLLSSSSSNNTTTAQLAAALKELESNGSTVK